MGDNGLRVAPLCREKVGDGKDAHRIILHFSSYVRRGGCVWRGRDQQALYVYKTAINFHNHSLITCTFIVWI